MATKKTRAWYVDKLLSIGIVEKVTNAVTKDGYTSDWGSISEVKDLRMYTISKDVDLAINALTETWLQIPSQFHEDITYRVISHGYKDPRNLNINNADYFDLEYKRGIRSAKKFSKSNYQSTGTIKPQDF